MSTPLVGWILRAWGAIGVSRQGGDSSAVRKIFGVLAEGRGICIAGEGTRSRSGRLGPMNRSLMRIVLRAAGMGVPVFPVVETGTCEALPPGSLGPKPFRIRCTAGEPLDLSRFVGTRVSEQNLRDAADLVRSSLADLLPPERRPAPGSPSLS